MRLKFTHPCMCHVIDGCRATAFRHLQLLKILGTLESKSTSFSCNNLHLTHILPLRKPYTVTIRVNHHPTIRFYPNSTSGVARLADAQSGILLMVPLTIYLENAQPHSVHISASLSHSAANLTCTSCIHRTIHCQSCHHSVCDRHINTARIEATIRRRMSRTAQSMYTGWVRSRMLYARIVLYHRCRTNGSLLSQRSDVYGYHWRCCESYLEWI